MGNTGPNRRWRRETVTDKPKQIVKLLINYVQSPDNCSREAKLAA